MSVCQGRVSPPLGDAALDVENEGPALLGVEALAGHHRLELAAVAREVGVVEIGGDAEADVAGRIDGQNRVVEIQQVGLVLVDQVDRAVEELLDVGLVQRRLARLLPVVLADRVILGVEILRIEAFPPKPLPSALVSLPS